MNRYGFSGGVITDQNGRVRNEIDLQNEKFYAEKDLIRIFRLFSEHLDLASCVVMGMGSLLYLLRKFDIMKEVTNDCILKCYL